MKSTKSTKSAKNLLTVVTLGVCLTVLGMVSLASPSYAVDPNQSYFHLYGALESSPFTPPDRTIWLVTNYATGYTMRVDCYYAEANGCGSVGQGHWLVIDGYLSSEGVCYDGPCNILRVTKALAWNPVTGSWYQIVSPKQ